MTLTTTSEGTTMPDRPMMGTKKVTILFKWSSVRANTGMRVSSRVAT